MKEVDGELHELMEWLFIDVFEDYFGVVI